ncbi:hypothetical protein QBC36DRAFT_309561 [Triangularia setosa]|uniref:Hemerythrin-like domain-containing protein n=1 Tax=Triangularia setosa TaxID=2587417 RepID=A0AAN6WBJ3_9PEZI|nr:hypothetical protein QBC36DRAFT_309561 [Podospora setosa]
MATAAGNRVSDRIKHDHREPESYYNKIKSATSDGEKVRWQNQFVWELARHSIAEELVVYPAMRKKDRGELQIMEASDPSFILAIDSLWEILAQHIKEEEQDDLPLLEKHIEEGDSEKMAASFSHPGAPDKPPYETVAGLMAAPIDKLMDIFKELPSAEKRND